MGDIVEKDFGKFAEYEGFRLYPPKYRKMLGDFLYKKEGIDQIVDDSARGGSGDSYHKQYGWSDGSQADRDWMKDYAKGGKITIDKEKYEYLKEVNKNCNEALNSIAKKQGSYAKGGVVAVRGYGDISYSDFQDISANIEIDGQDEIEKIDIDEIDGGSPHDIFSQIDDIITRRAQTDSKYDNAELTLVEFELKDGSFFDIYDLEDDFYSSEWRDNRYAKGGKIKRKRKSLIKQKYQDLFEDQHYHMYEKYYSKILKLFEI